MYDGKTQQKQKHSDVVSKTGDTHKKKYLDIVTNCKGIFGLSYVIVRYEKDKYYQAYS